MPSGVWGVRGESAGTVRGVLSSTPHAVIATSSCNGSWRWRGGGAAVKHCVRRTAHVPGISATAGAPWDAVWTVAAGAP